MNSEPVPLEPSTPKNRTTVILRVHHQCRDEGVTTAGCTYDDELETSHEAYGRRLTATSEWQPLDFGWIPPQDVGRIIIENLAGRNLQVNPTADERRAIADQVLEVWHDGDRHSFFIGPRGADSFQSSCPSLLRIRTRGADTRYRIMVVPR